MKKEKKIPHRVVLTDAHSSPCNDFFLLSLCSPPCGSCEKDRVRALEVCGRGGLLMEARPRSLRRDWLLFALECA